MKILYIADRWDPKDHSQASGTDYEIYHALMRGGAEVDVVGPFQQRFSILEKLLMGLHNRLFDTNLFKYSLGYFFQSARMVNRAVVRKNYDLLVSMYSAPLVLTHFNQPLLYFCDSSVKWLKKQWKNHAAFTYFTMTLWETHVINKANHIITFSESNAVYLRDEYHVPEDQLDYFAIPASIPHDMVPDEVNVEKELAPVKLLLVGRDYHRKGVDIAQKIVRGLNSQGVNAVLRIVGLEGKKTEFTEFFGFYDKTDPEGLDNYLSHYRWANFLLHPARFEAAGIVPSEAAAFGVPTLTNDTGGLATTVRDSVSGIVLPEGSSAERYIDVILDFFKDPVEYHQLVKSTKYRYQLELNWHVVEERIMQIIKNLV